MRGGYKLADAEQEVMQVLWETGLISTGDLLELMNRQGKKWKRQTLNTLLARLEEKGVVSRERAFVEAKISEKELVQRQTKEILDHFYGGKLKNFFAALVGDASIDDEDVESLNALIDELQNK